MLKRIGYVTLMVTLLSAPMLISAGCALTQEKESTSGAVEDKAITAQVKTALLKDPEVQGTQVNVTTYNGVVQLSGFVDSPGAKSRASQIAQSTPGVQDVRNDLIVSTGR